MNVKQQMIVVVMPSARILQEVIIVLVYLGIQEME